MPSTDRLEEKLDELQEGMFTQFTELRQVDLEKIKEAFAQHAKEDTQNFTALGGKVTLLIWIVGIVSAAARPAIIKAVTDRALKPAAEDSAPPRFPLVDQSEPDPEFFEQSVFDRNTPWQPGDPVRYRPGEE